MTAENRQAKFVKGIWARLPAGQLTQSELDGHIIRIARLHEGDHAAAQAVRSTLLISKAITARPSSEPGGLVYEKVAALPAWPLDNGPGTPGFNAELDRVRAAEGERFAEIDRQRQLDYENSPLAQQRRMWDLYLDAKLAPIHAELAALRAQVAELTEVPQAAA